MKIVLCNKYFFINGGQEKYISDLMRHLPRMGHTSVPFSVRYAGSWDTPYIPYFLPPPGPAEQTHFKHIRLSPSNMIRHLDRGVYSMEARIRLNRLLKKENDIEAGYLLNIYNYMSPSIIDTLHAFGLPVILQLGDYHLLCPNYSLLRNGKPCTLCLSGQYSHGLRHRCVGNSISASAVRVASMYIHRLMKIYHRVDAMVVPCLFMRDRLIEGGFSPHRIHLLRYPVDVTDNIPHMYPKKPYLLYFGRLSFEKGIDTLIQAFQMLRPPVSLYIAGKGPEGETKRLKRLIHPDNADRIRFLGFKSGESLSRLIGEALFSVVPSRWYDNAPISIYESYQHHTPVVASNIGGIPEQIQNEVTGKLFAPDSVKELVDAMEWMLSDKDRLIEMGKAGSEYVRQELSIDRHIEQLIALFRKVAKVKRR